MILSLNAIAADPDPYVEALQEKRVLKLSDGKEILLSYHSSNEDTLSKIRIFLRNKGEVLWDKTFVNEYDELWHRVHFIPVTEGKFIEDLNDDGFPEIGIANWNGGKAPCASAGLVFTVKNETLEFLKKQEVNTEFSRQVYKTKNDFKNQKYKDPLCNY